MVVLIIFIIINDKRAAHTNDLNDAGNHDHSNTGNRDQTNLNREYQRHDNTCLNQREDSDAISQFNAGERRDGLCISSDQCGKLQRCWCYSIFNIRSGDELFLSDPSSSAAKFQFVVGVVVVIGLTLVLRTPRPAMTPSSIIGLSSMSIPSDDNNNLSLYSCGVHAMPGTIMTFAGGESK